MFNKAATPPPRRPSEVAPVDTVPSGRRALSAGAPSLLGADLIFEGNISGEGELHIEGAVRGEIHVARLVVGQNSQVDGTVRGNQIEVRGRIAGKIEARAVKLYETACVEGDIVYEQLSVEVGAVVQGHCQKIKQQPVAPAQE